MKGPVLILAGAGTGKTRVITHRLAYLIAHGVLPRNILAVTFTNKAAREMLERVRQLLPPSRKVGKSERGDTTEKKEKAAEAAPTICTFHSLGVRILRKHIQHLGYKSNFVIYDTSDQLAALRKVLASLSSRDEAVDPQKVLPMLSRFRNGDTRGAAFADPADLVRMEMVTRRYESALRACNAVDFDDLILLTLRLFREYPEALEAAREQFQHVMVDEYQDTNAAQFELIHSLTSQSRNLCVVGDDDQSIYGWRGAEVANLLHLERHFPEVRIIKLEQNYRSTNIILRAANALIRGNPRRREKNLWSAHGEGSRIQCQAFETDEAEAKAVAENLQYDHEIRRIPWRHQAVLFRTNLQSRPIETALRQQRIRYRLVGGQSFFDRRDVRDVLAYLKVLTNPHDDVSLLRIANVPSRGLSDVTMERVLAASQERKCSVYAAMRHSDVQEALPTRAADAVRSWTTWIDTTRLDLETAGVLSLSSWIETLLSGVGYWQEVKRWEKDPEVGEFRIKSLRDMLSTIDKEPVTGTNALDRLSAFLAEVTLDSDREDDNDAEADVVTLITMHSCKGLEFPHVHIVGLEDGLLPHSRSKLEGTMDEERRLFYVALTRARETLRISHCGGRRRYGQMMPCHPSPFLKELPEECVEDAAANSRRIVAQGEATDYFALMRAATSDPA